MGGEEDVGADGVEGVNGWSEAAGVGWLMGEKVNVGSGVIAYADEEDEEDWLDDDQVDELEMAMYGRTSRDKRNRRAIVVDHAPSASPRPVLPLPRVNSAKAPRAGPSQTGTKPRDTGKDKAKARPPSVKVEEEVTGLAPGEEQSTSGERQVVPAKRKGYKGTGEHAGMGRNWRKGLGSK
jgi:hypothetical protein